MTHFVIEERSSGADTFPALKFWMDVVVVIARTAQSDAFLRVNMRCVIFDGFHVDSSVSMQDGSRWEIPPFFPQCSRKW